jgi:hypothetical protein
MERSSLPPPPPVRRLRLQNYLTDFHEILHWGVKTTNCRTNFYYGVILQEAQIELNFTKTAYDAKN